jgi:FMN phosphatase YigB (HAD superfamily)
LLIGDDAANDFYGALQAGWKAIIVDRDDRHADLSPRMTDLRQLL